MSHLLCLPEITASADRPIWIRRDDFLRFVHVQNYLCRDVQQVHPNAYLTDWFRPLEHGGVSFSLPSVYLKDGRIAFINGRHRTAVLIEHLELLPMAITNADADKALFNNIKQSDLNLGTLIEIPDLPILAKEALEKFVDRSLPCIPTPEPW